MTFYILISNINLSQMNMCIHKFTASDYHFPVFSPFMPYLRVCNKINPTGATKGAGTAYPSGAQEFTPVFSGIRVTRSLVLCVSLWIVVCPFLLFLLAVMLSDLLRYADSNQRLGIFKLFLISSNIFLVEIEKWQYL